MDLLDTITQAVLSRLASMTDLVRRATRGGRRRHLVSQPLPAWRRPSARRLHPRTLPSRSSTAAWHCRPPLSTAWRSSGQWAPSTGGFGHAQLCGCVALWRWRAARCQPAPGVADQRTEQSWRWELMASLTPPCALRPVPLMPARRTGSPLLPPTRALSATLVLLSPLALVLLALGGVSGGDELLPSLFSYSPREEAAAPACSPAAVLCRKAAWVPLPAAHLELPPATCPLPFLTQLRSSHAGVPAGHARPHAAARRCAVQLPALQGAAHGCPSCSPIGGSGGGAGGLADSGGGGAPPRALGRQQRWARG